jgi:DNA repair protein RadC
VANEDRKLGIDVLGALPWGEHLCYFYKTKQDLVDVLVPYFKAGLENNESCIWITPEAISNKEAKEAMEKAIPDFSQHLANGQIEVIPYTDWYLKGDIFNAKKVLNAWLDKLERAIASGYDGLRVSGDTAWVKRKDWDKFCAYEKEVNNAISKYRMLALCTYLLYKYGTSQALKVMSNHRYSLMKYKDQLTLIGSSEFQQAEAPLHLQSRIEANMSAGYSFVTAGDAVIRYANPKFEAMFGYEPGEMIGKHVSILNAPSEKSPEETAETIQGLLDKNGEWKGEIKNIRKDGTPFWCYANIFAFDHPDYGRVNVAIHTDITERKKAAEKEQAIINVAIDGFWVSDTNGKFLEVNDSYCQMIGYTREELLKMSISDVEALERPEDTAARIKNTMLRGSDRLKTQHRCKDGRIIDLEISVAYYKEGKGQFFVFIHDITALKHAEERREILLRNKPERHLAQLQQRFIRSSFEELEDKDIIELLLSLALPVQKAKQLAKVCMEQFKNLSDFLAASPEELQRIGITPTCMLCIKLLHELPTKVLKQRIVARSIYKSSKEVFDYLYYSMRDLKKEVFKVIYLNNRSQIIDTADLFEGTADNILIRAREIIESTLTRGTTGLIFVHNHPTGDPTPSRSDKQITRDLVFVGNILQIKVLDHIIIGADSYFSFTDDGLTQKYQDSFLNLKIKGVLSSRPLYQIYRRLPKGFHHQHLNKLFNKYQLPFRGLFLLVADVIVLSLLVYLDGAASSALSQLVC